MGTTLNLVRDVVGHTVEKYVQERCAVVGQSKDGCQLYGCESGIFAKAAMNRINFEFQVGLENFPSCCREEFGEWLFYSAKIKPVERLLRESGINISV